MTHPPFCRYRRSRGALQFQQRCFLMGKSGIPCFFYGAGIPTDLFAKDAAGSHLQIAPTLAELILPQGETYESLLPSLLIPGEPSTIAFILRMDKSAKKRTSKIRNSRQKSKRPGPLPFGESKMAMRLGQSNKRRYKSILGR